jgi:hypothetical protein
MRANPRGLLITLSVAILLAACHPDVTPSGEPGGGGSSAGGAASGGSGAGGHGGASGAGGAGGGYGGTGGAALAGCADALIALDRSCSMNKTPKGFTKSKYAVAQDVLKALTTEYDGKMAFGLNAYPPLPSEGTKCDAGKVYAGIQLGSGAAIATAIARLDPSLPANQNCGTPTGANLEMLINYAPLRTGRKHNVILVTDGMPSCANETVPRSVAAIEKLRALDVRTFVVGYVAGANVEALDLMAEAGGEPQPPPSATRYFNAADADQLNFSLRKILSTICGDIPTPTCPPTAPTCSAGASCPAGTTCASGCCFPIIQ